MKLPLCVTLLLVSLSACSLLPPIPGARPDGSARIPVNNPQLTAEFSRQHAALPGTVPAQPKNGLEPVEISLVQMLEQYIPTTYQVFPAPGIALERRVRYDRSRAWADAVVAALATSGLVATIDPARHAVFINARPASPAAHE